MKSGLVSKNGSLEAPEKPPVPAPFAPALVPASRAAPAPPPLPLAPAPGAPPAPELATPTPALFAMPAFATLAPAPPTRLAPPPAPLLPPLLVKATDQSDELHAPSTSPKRPEHAMSADLSMTAVAPTWPLTHTG